MGEIRKNPGQLVFGLDIGTRSIVGTVGYKVGERFVIVAQRVREHETRAMLDGQIHDISRVGDTINQVKKDLEEVVGAELHDVCIAAAGRVLKTVTVNVKHVYEEEQEITAEDIYELDSKGIEAAYNQFNEANMGETDIKFYCVGYSVVRYHLNHYPIGNLEGHKAKEVEVDLIATFLPEDVVNGLYKAVRIAGLEVSNLTLEPIAAILLAIPEKYRMLNIALVDVGAGTSDISITQGGSIVAYGMIPTAGDALTEAVAEHCLVDFATAETIKREYGEKDTVEYRDIIGLPQIITKETMEKVTGPVIDNMTRQVADKIRELNGDKPVSAVFVVGGGGKIPNYTRQLASYLGIPEERCVLRGEEVMEDVEFREEGVTKDSLLVTPIGICLSFYENNNNFIFVLFNESRVKLYDNSRLAVVDAAMQADFSNEHLFPKRGKALTFTVDGKQRMVRGELGEAAVITVNGSVADIYTQIRANDVIKVQESTAGRMASLRVGKLPEYQSNMTFEINGARIVVPKFVSVNGQLQSEYYEIQENDEIDILNYYTVRQISEFMDVTIDKSMHIYVNNKRSDMDTRVYENFSVLWTMEELLISDVEADRRSPMDEAMPSDAGLPREGSMAAEDSQAYGAESAAGIPQEMPEMNHTMEAPAADGEAASRESATETISVMVNHAPILLTGKKSYVFVDVFDKIKFDLSRPKGRSIATVLNGRDAQYMEALKAGDQIEIYWREE